MYGCWNCDTCVYHCAYGFWDTIGCNLPATAVKFPPTPSCSRGSLIALFYFYFIFFWRRPWWGASVYWTVSMGVWHICNKPVALHVCVVQVCMCLCLCVCVCVCIALPSNCFHYWPQVIPLLFACWLTSSLSGYPLAVQLDNSLFLDLSLSGFALIWRLLSLLPFILWADGLFQSLPSVVRSPMHRHICLHGVAELYPFLLLLARSACVALNLPSAGSSHACMEWPYVPPRLPFKLWRTYKCIYYLLHESAWDTARYFTSQRRVK